MCVSVQVSRITKWRKEKEKEERKERRKEEKRRKKKREKIEGSYLFLF